MHGTYTFLLSLDCKEDDNLVAEARSRMDSYAEKSCDENNGFTEMALVMKDGHVFQMAKSDDWRGRDDFYTGVVEIPQDQRWEYARKTAMRCILNDMGLDGPSISFGEEDPSPLDTMSFDGLIAYVHAAAPAKIGQGFLALTPPVPPPPRNFDMEWWRLRKLTEGYLQLREAEQMPFGDSSLTPYEYRAMDLTDGEEANAVLFVDIHT